MVGVDLHGQYKTCTGDCGLRTADCGLRTADCGLRTADWAHNMNIGIKRGLNIADCRLNAAYRLQPMYLTDPVVTNIT